MPISSNAVTSTKIFVPRTVAPLTDETWYSTKYNPCISRYNGTVLPNCFVGNTSFITTQGVITLKAAFELCKKGVEFEVPTVDDEWHVATVKYFGIQRLYRVELEGSVYYCTGNHRWLISTKSGIKAVTTVELKSSMKIPYRMCNTDKYTHMVSVTDTGRYEGVYCVVEPITRSFTLSGGEITGNCVGYAHGRFCEILGYFHPDLPRCDAGDWLDTLRANKHTDLTWGSTPKLGAVAVWKNPGAAGHVAVVEAINSDGTIMLSESGYSSSWNTRFWNSGPRSAPNWYGAPYQFQGFIYNPATENVVQTVAYSDGVSHGTNIPSDSPRYSGVWLNSAGNSAVNNIYYSSYSTAIDHPARIFVKSAVAHAGSLDGHSWVQKLTGVEKNRDWSVAFCCASAIESCFSASVVPTNQFSATEFAKQLVDKLGGQFFESGRNQNISKPQTGDIFGIRNVSSTLKYSASHVGIVREIHGDIVLTVEGNISNKIVLSRRKVSDLSWWIRPDWTIVGGTPECTSLVASPLYNSYNTRADATLREVAYMKDTTEPSIKKSSVTLSAINYTDMLSSIYDIAGGSHRYIQSSYDWSTSESYTGSSTYTVDYSELQPTNAKLILEYLLEKGLSISISVGFLANIEAESSYSTSAVNSSSGASGLCQWLGTRKTAMIERVGKNWRDNLTGQLEFLWWELHDYHKGTLETLLAEVKGVDLESTLQATDIILRKFEAPGHYDVNTPIRAEIAKRIWSMLHVIQLNSGTPLNNNISFDIRTYSGKSIEVGRSTPVSVGSSSIVPFNFQFIESVILDASGHKLHDLWKQQTSNSKYSLAILNGYFLISTSLYYGVTGDIVSVVLDDGTYFNAIVLQNSSDDSILKWISASASSDVVESGIRQSGWSNKRIVKIVNYGTWLDR